MSSSGGNMSATAAFSSPMSFENQDDSHIWEANLPSMPVPYEEFQFSLDLPSTLSFDGGQFDPSELSMLGSPPFGGETAGPSHSMHSLGNSRSRPTSPHRGPPSKPPPPPFDPPAGGSLFDLPPVSPSSSYPTSQDAQPPSGDQGNSLFDPSERSFLSSFLEGFQDWEFDPSLPKDMPSFKDASLRAGIPENANSPSRGFKSSSNRRGASSGSGSGSGWSPHNGNSGTGQTPPSLGINTSGPTDSQRASAAFGGLSGWSDVDEEDASTTPTGTNGNPEKEGEVGRKRSASTANRNNNPNQADTPESVMSNDTNDSRVHSAYNAFIISYAPPHPSSTANQHQSASNQNHQQNQQPFRPPPPSYASRVQMQSRPPPQSQNSYQQLQALQNQMYGNPGLEGMMNGKKIKTGHGTSAASIQRAPSSQSPSQNDAHSQSGSANGATSSSSKTPAPSRQLLTDSEKRQNHILSEQRRRNFIREGFKELVELLEAGRGFGARGLGLSSGDGTGVEDEGLDDRSDPSDDEDGLGIILNKKKKKSKRAAPAGRRGRGKGRGRGGSAGGGGGSKSAVLFQAVDLIRWLEVKNAELEKSCEKLENWDAAAGGENVMQE